MLDQSVAVARRSSVPEDRVASLIALSLLPNLDQQQRDEIVQEALASVRTTTDHALLTQMLSQWASQLVQANYPQEAVEAVRAISLFDERAEALASLIPLLPENVRQSLLRESFEAVVEMDDHRKQPEALAILAPCLPADLLRVEALNRTRRNPWWEQLEIFAALAPYLPPEALGGMLKDILPNQLETEPDDALHALFIKTDWHQYAKTIALLASQLPEAQLEELLDVGKGLRDPNDRVMVLTALATRLPQEQRLIVLHEALDTCRGIEYPTGRALALVKVVPLLPTVEQERVLPEVLDAVRAVQFPRDQASALTEFAARLAEGQRLLVFSEMLGVIRAIERTDIKGEALAELSLYLPTQFQGEALAIAQSLGESQYQVLVLTNLAPRLSGDLLRSALSMAQSIYSERWRAQALIILTPYLSGELQKTAIEAAASIGWEHARAEALIGMVPHLSKRISEALKVARGIHSASERARTLTKLALFLPRKARDQALLNVLEAQEIGDTSAQQMILVGLALYLPPKAWHRVLQDAPLIEENELSATQRKVLMELVLYLPETPQGETQLAAEDFLYSPALSFARLARYLPQPRRAELLDEILEEAWLEERDQEWAQMLVISASYLSTAQKAQAVSRAQAWGINRRLQIKVLMGLLPHVEGPLADEMHQDALNAARSLSRPGERARELAALAPYLPKPVWEQVLPEALQEVYNIEDINDRALALAKLAPHVSEELQSKVLQATLGYLNGETGNLAHALARSLDVGSAYYREALIALIPHLPQGIKDGVLREVLAGLVLHVPDMLKDGRVRQAITPWIRDRERRSMEVLVGICQFLPEQLHEEALALARAMEDGYARSTSLAALAQLQPEVQGKGALLQEALDAAHAIPYLDERASVLLWLIHRMPESRRQTVLLEGLATARAILDERVRYHLLTKLVPHLCQLPSAKLYLFWQETLHELAMHRRSELLTDLHALSPIIIALGGVDAVEDILHVIRHIASWWP